MPPPERLRFWFGELRTPEFLVELAQLHPETVGEAAKERPLLKPAAEEDLASGSLARALRTEEEAEKHRDAEYWKPLRERLERIRRSREKK